MKSLQSSNPTKFLNSRKFPLTVLCLLLATLEPSSALMQLRNQPLFPSKRTIDTPFTNHVSLCMVMALPDKDTSASSDAKDSSSERFKPEDKRKRNVRKKYQRKRIPETERERRRLSQERQEKYEQIVSNANGEGPSVWSFEGLFPKAVWDEKSIERDLYEIKRRDTKTEQSKQPAKKSPRSKMKTSAIGASSMMRVWRDPKLSSFILPYDPPRIPEEREDTKDVMTEEEAASKVFEPTLPGSKGVNASISERLAAQTVKTNSSGTIDYKLTRMVEDKIYGYRRGTGGQSVYDSSLLEDGAVKFRDGVRLGNPLPVNAARLNYHAKKELRNNRVEEAQELYETAIRIDPRDGRAYMGLSRCAERRRDFKLAREFLNFGIANTFSTAPDGTPDAGGNPFLLQALGCLEEKCGHLAEAEALYIEAAKSRPSHAASWVALAQLRTRKFRQSAAAGRACYQAAERELHKAGMPPSSHVYTAWASLEYKKGGDMRRARNLYKEALKVDKRCSAAWLQLGVMEADCEHWREAELCFETVMKFDQRNSRVLQAYAIMESKRPDSNSRKVIGLFERALRVNSRDAGVLQPYALYVAELGDIESARDLLKRGTEVNKRHAPVWQAWGVLETRHDNPEEARNIFQQGIWACAQQGGGQSGGYKCARLWQAWGVLEAKEGDIAAARRCFSRALDADKCNMAAMTAWTIMEEEIGNLQDTRVLFERALKQFTSASAEKKNLWRAYELMEQRAGNTAHAKEVFQRALRESFRAAQEQEDKDDADGIKRSGISLTTTAGQAKPKESKSDDTEREVSRWERGSSMQGEVWMNNGSIEGKVPEGTMNKQRKQKKDTPPV